MNRVVDGQDREKIDKTIQCKGINHLAMVTANMDRTIRFWRDFLGMRLVAGLGSKNYRHYFLEGSDPRPGRWPGPISESVDTDQFIYPGEGKLFEQSMAAKEP